MAGYRRVSFATVLLASVYLSSSMAEVNQPTALVARAVCRVVIATIVTVNRETRQQERHIGMLARRRNVERSTCSGCSVYTRTYLLLNGRAISQPVSRWLPTAVVDKVALGQVFPE
jgi:hypothetical protein